MFGLLAYAIVAGIAAAVIQLIRGLLTRNHSGEGSGPVQLIAVWLIVMAIPYVWVEWQTRSRGQEFSSIVDEVYEREFVDGAPAYYKVIYANDEHARLVLVCNGEYHWGGTYRNLYNLLLSRDKDQWVLSAVDAVNTADGDSAGFTIPPYW